ncbi:MAG: hypothetical protein ACYSR4_09200, partial [Planctomycetota bacterium]
MDAFFALLILLAVACLLSGPVALIVSIIALNRSKTTYHEPVPKRPPSIPIPPMAERQSEETEEVSIAAPTEPKKPA